jgi:SnoaL-like domain
VPENEPWQRLVDIHAITQVKARYCLLLDTKQWDAWRELFTEDLVVEGTKQQPDATRDDFVAGVKEALAGVQTVHQVHPPVIEFVDDRTARVVSPMFDDLRFPEGHPWREGFPRRLGYGHYEEEYRKDDGTWRISFMRLARLFVWREADGVPVEGGVPSAGAQWLATGRRVPT